MLPLIRYYAMLIICAMLPRADAADFFDELFHAPCCCALLMRLQLCFAAIAYVTIIDTLFAA